MATLYRTIPSASRAKIYAILAAINALALLIYQKTQYFTLDVIYYPYVKTMLTMAILNMINFRVSNATISVANVENAHHSTRLLAQTTLR